MMLTRKAEKEIKYLIGKIEHEIENYYGVNFPKDIIDFNKLTSECEHNTLRECISLIPKVKSKKNKQMLQLAVVSFYYLVVASEYYVYINPANIIVDIDLDCYLKMLMKVSSSDEEWASKIRRLVYKF